MVLEAIRYKRGSLQILNQLLLPHATEYNAILSSEDAWHAIRSMRTRGAPAIAIVAALALAVEIVVSPIPPSTGPETPSASDVQDFINRSLDYLVTSRPTAVNLADAAGKLKNIVAESARKEGGGGEGEVVVDAYVKAAEQMLVDDVSDNEAIGRNGSRWIKENTELGRQGTVSIVTHCNTGSLATAGYGTALGVIRSLHAARALEHVFCTETRPYNQGSRLTAYELAHDKIPATLITDSMAAALLRLRGRENRIAAIVVGADRVAANGDTANKIGTYSLAILARHHGLKFLVAAPRTTIDLQTKSGAEIVVEERPSEEVTMVKGPRYHTKAKMVELGTLETVSIAASDIGVWNPAFDVTPAELIDGIITEVGVAERDADQVFHLGELFQQHHAIDGANVDT